MSVLVFTLVLEYGTRQHIILWAALPRILCPTVVFISSAVVQDLRNDYELPMESLHCPALLQTPAGRVDVSTAT